MDAKPRKVIRQNVGRPATLPYAARLPVDQTGGREECRKISERTTVTRRGDRYGTLRVAHYCSESGYLIEWRVWWPHTQPGGMLI